MGLLNSPLTLAVAGVIIDSAAMPLVKKVGRRALIMGTRGVLAINDQMKETTTGISRSWQEIIQEARSIQ